MTSGKSILHFIPRIFFLSEFVTIIPGPKLPYSFFSPFLGINTEVANLQLYSTIFAVCVSGNLHSCA